MTTIQPTFLLKSIKVADILTKYLAGEFATFVPTAKIKIITNTPLSSNIPLDVYGTDNTSGLFIYGDKSHNKLTIATSGHKAFTTFMLGGGTVLSGGRCMYCLTDFDHEICGYPVAHETTNVLNEQGLYQVFYTFWIEGVFCSDECSLAHLQQSSRRDSTLANSEMWLKFLYRLKYPEQVLKAACHPSLLDVNGGSITRKKWSENRWNKTGAILIIPTKREFILAQTENA